MNDTAIETTDSNHVEPLFRAWADIKRTQPGLRIRDAAKLLNVSEMALLLTEDPGRVGALYFADGLNLLQQLPELGQVMALTRNDACVHERTGVFAAPKGNSKMALTLGEQDQRYFLSQWRYYLHVRDPKRESLQVFDANGNALWKLFTTDGTDQQAWRALMDKHRGTQAKPEQLQDSSNNAATAFTETANTDTVTPIHHQRELLERWAALTDVHQFHGLLKDLQLTRQQAYDLAQSKWTRQLNNNSAQRLLEFAQTQKSPLMIFTGNHGLIQIFTGEVQNLRRTGPWFNVLDAGFNLHLNTDKIAETWHISRPTKDGVVNSVECFDAQGTSIVTFFGERHEGEHERTDWRDNLQQLEVMQ